MLPHSRPGASSADLATVGEGKHLRFRVRRDGADAGSAIAFGIGSRLDIYRQEGRWDVAFRLSENRWNGTVSPQLVVRRIFAADPRVEELREWLVGEYRKPEAVRNAEAAAIFAELGPGKRHVLESERFHAALLGRRARARPLEACARPQSEGRAGFAGAALLSGDEDRPAEQTALEAQVVVATLFVTFANPGRVGVVGIGGEPFLERAPVIRLVPVPVVLRGGDEPDEGETGGLEARDGLRERHPALVLDLARQRPLAPVRLADRDESA